MPTKRNIFTLYKSTRYELLYATGNKKVWHELWPATLCATVLATLLKKTNSEDERRKHGVANSTTPFQAET